MLFCNVFVLSLIVVFMLVGCVILVGGFLVSVDLMVCLGSVVFGNVCFVEMNGCMWIEVKVVGLMLGEYGFYVYEVGDCSVFDVSSVKGYFNLVVKVYGYYGSGEFYGGDMLNLVVNVQGEVYYMVELSGMSLSGLNSIVGCSVVIYVDLDDYKLQLVGNLGKWIVCGVIVVC